MSQRLGKPGRIRQEASHLAGRSERANQRSPEMRGPPETDGGTIGSAEPVLKRRRPVSSAMALGIDGRRDPRGRRGRHVKKEHTVKARNQSWAAGMVIPAKALRISCAAVKSRCAHEWGRWGRVSEDEPGQHNPDRSEGPWGRAALAARTVVRLRAMPPTLSGDSVVESGTYEGQMQTDRHRLVSLGKALSDIPALKPYCVGFHVESVRAIALPDPLNEAECMAAISTCTVRTEKECLAYRGVHV